MEIKINLGFCAVLTILFIILKVIGFIAWSWWWVFSPIWIPFVIVIGFIMLILISALLSDQ